MAAYGELKGGCKMLAHPGAVIDCHSQILPGEALPPRHFEPAAKDIGDMVGLLTQERK